MRFHAAAGAPRKSRRRGILLGVPRHAASFERQRKGAKAAMFPIAATDGAAAGPSARASDLELRQLRAFVALVETGGMAAAARRLGVAQSTMSEAIAALDRALGAPVVTRRPGARGAALTAAGEALLPHARAVLAALDQAAAAVAATTRESRARVEVIANESASTYLLPRALATLRERWPNTRFAVSVGTCDAVRAGLAAGAYDVGLSFETATAPARAGEPLAEVLALVPLVLFAAAGHPLLAADAVRRADLAGHTVFASDAAGDFHALLRADLGHGPAAPRLEAAGTVEAVKRSVTRVRGALGVLPSYAVADELRRGALRAIHLRPPPPRVRLEARLAAGRPHGPAAGELVAALRAAVAGERPRRRARRG